MVSTSVFGRPKTLCSNFSTEANYPDQAVLRVSSVTQVLQHVTLVPFLHFISFHFIFVHLIQRGHSPQDIEHVIISIHYTMWHKLQFCHWQQSRGDKCLQ